VEHCHLETGVDTIASTEGLNTATKEVGTATPYTEVDTAYPAQQGRYCNRRADNACKAGACLPRLIGLLCQSLRVGAHGLSLNTQATEAI
jgi:hypothetical protein